MDILLTIIHLIDFLLWLFVAGSVFYVSLFAIISLFPTKSSSKNINKESRRTRFLVLFPAYKEDRVIINSLNKFVEQDYPRDCYDVAVIADHMQDDTIATLSNLPIKVLVPHFDKSSKAKALQYAIGNIGSDYDYVVILDADNVVENKFLTQLNQKLSVKQYTAIQCHRCAKNKDNEIAVLDGVSEEINNSIFRKAHNAIGLSSALIGSGMCIKYNWFADNVNLLTTAGEDRELEALLLRQGKYIKYEEFIYVYDEKVSNQDNFQRQRLRWMTAQLQSLSSMLPYIPKAIRKHNVDYIDKTIQQALIPRSILIALTLLLSVITLIINPVASIKWWCLFFSISIAILIATPSKLRTKSIVKSIKFLPRLIWKMCCNILRIDTSNKDFIHTTHDK